MFPGDSLTEILKRQRAIIDVESSCFSVIPSPTLIFCQLVVYLDHYENIQVWHEGSPQSKAYSLIYPETQLANPRTLSMSLIAYKLSILGAVICSCIVPETTHVITSSEKEKSGFNTVMCDLNRLTKNRFYVVSEDWVIESISRCGLADEESYSSL